MLTPRSGLSVGSVSLLGYLEEHPEVSKKLYTTISRERKAQSRPSHIPSTVVCYHKYVEECKAILRCYPNQKSIDTLLLGEFKEQAE